MQNGHILELHWTPFFFFYCYHLSVIHQPTGAQRPVQSLPHLCGGPTWVSASKRGALMPESAAESRVRALSQGCARPEMGGEGC